jgi:hypothetical protein
VDFFVSISELAAPRRTEELEGVLASTFADDWTVLGIVKPVFGISRFWPGYFRRSKKELQGTLTQMLETCSAIFMIPSHRGRTFRELQKLLENDTYLRKAVFFLPDFEAHIRVEALRILGNVHVSGEAIVRDELKTLEDGARARVAAASKRMKEAEAREGAQRELTTAFQQLNKIRKARRSTERMAIRLRDDWGRTRKAVLKLGLELPEFQPEGSIFVVNGRRKVEPVAGLNSLPRRVFKEIIQSAVQRNLLAPEGNVALGNSLGDSSTTSVELLLASPPLADEENSDESLQEGSLPTSDIAPGTSPIPVSTELLPPPLPSAPLVGPT